MEVVEKRGEEARVGVTCERGEKWRRRDAFIEGENNASARVLAEREGTSLCQAAPRKNEGSCHVGQNCVNQTTLKCWPGRKGTGLAPGQEP